MGGLVVRRGLTRPLALAAAVLLHALLLYLWSRAAPPAPRSLEVRAPAPMLLRLLPPRAEPPAAPTAAARPAQRGPARAAPAPQAITLPPVAETAPVQAAAPPASTPDAPLLDTDATRRALREAARDSTLAGQAAQDVGTPLRSKTEALGQQVEQAAKGDCMKGEFAGSGMGLLSLPFLAVAALNDQCRR